MLDYGIASPTKFRAFVQVKCIEEKRPPRVRLSYYRRLNSFVESIFILRWSIYL